MTNPPAVNPDDNDSHLDVRPDRAAFVEPTRQREWRWAFGMALLVASLVTMPEAWAAWHPPEGRTFVGSFWTTEDMTCYWTAMRDAASGSSWLVRDRLTPEAHQPALIYPLYIATAKLSAALHLPLEIGFGAFRFVSRIALVLALYSLVAAVVPPTSRRWTLNLVLGGGGFAFLFLLVSALTQSPQIINALDTEWRYIEFSTFLALFSYPHLLIALAALALIVRCHLGLTRAVQPRLLWVLAASLFLLGLSNSFSLVLVGLVLAAHGGLRWLTLRRLPLADILGLVVFAMVAGPFLLYSYVTFSQDPFWGVVYGAQNVPHLASPSVMAFLSGYGLLLPLGLGGVIALRRRRDTSARVLALWLVLGLAVMVAPVPYQRRLGLGSHHLLALAAAYALIAIGQSPWWKGRHGWFQKAAAYGLFVGLGGSTLGAAAIVLSSALGYGPLTSSVFERADVASAAQWLAQHSTTEDVLLATEQTSRTALRFIPGRAVLAHPIATLDPETKRREVSVFFDTATPDEKRLELVRRFGVTLVFQGPAEAASGAANFDDRPWLQRLYETQELAIYRVRVGDIEATSASPGEESP